MGVHSEHQDKGSVHHSGHFYCQEFYYYEAVSFLTMSTCKADQP